LIGDARRWASTANRQGCCAGEGPVDRGPRETTTRNKVGADGSTLSERA